jgi:3-hydroxybutyryl-CoA dehydrogenase
MPTIGIIGAGTMGAGIAQVAASNGWDVKLMDVDPELIVKSIGDIKRRLDRQAEKGKVSPEEAEAIKARVASASGPEALADCELVIEAVVESLDVKNTVFASILPHLKPGAFLATNTSSLSVTRMGEALGEPARVVGMHFFNPVPLMPLVEIISGDHTDPAVADRAFAIAESWGKTVVRAKDTPGFIVNRVARGFYLEALRMLGEGMAGVAEIDAAMKKLGGFRMGPFELMDLVGIDVNYGVSVSVWEQLGKPARLTPHPIQKELFTSGNFGRKTGRGAYRHDGETPVPAIEVKPEVTPSPPPDAVKEAVAAFVEKTAAESGSELESYIFARVLVAIVNEAAFAHDEGVATRDDIDTAMQKGTNYPQGPLAWGERAGYAACARLLEALNATVEDGRFAPAALLKSKG